MRKHILILIISSMFLSSTLASVGKSDSITYFDVAGLKDNYSSRVFTLKNISPIPLIPLLRRHIPVNGSFVGIAPIGTVILSDSEERLELFTALLSALDSYGQSGSGDIGLYNRKISELMSQIGSRSISCGNNNKVMPKNMKRHKIELGEFNQKWVVIVKNFINNPESLEILKSDNSIAFDDSNKKHNAIKSLVQGLKSISLSSQDMDHKSSPASLALKKIITKGEANGYYDIKCK